MMKEVIWMKEGLFNAATPEATEGECSEPKEAGGVAATPDPEVPEKAVRRKFSAEYKLRISMVCNSPMLVKLCSHHPP